MVILFKQLFWSLWGWVYLTETFNHNKVNGLEKNWGRASISMWVKEWDKDGFIEFQKICQDFEKSGFTSLTKLNAWRYYVT